MKYSLKITRMGGYGDNEIGHTFFIAGTHVQLSPDRIIIPIDKDNFWDLVDGIIKTEEIKEKRKRVLENFLEVNSQPGEQLRFEIE